jgi:hypothetical protein
MAESVKILQVGAFKQEAGLVPTNSAWGGASSPVTLGAGNAFPYLSLGKGKTINSVSDNSITTSAFSDTTRKVTEYVERAISMHNRFDDMEKFLYWSFGFENAVKNVTVFVVNTPTTQPTAGATYTTDSKTFTFMRKEVWGATTYQVFLCTTIAPTSQTGTLTKSAGTGDATLTYTSHSGLMYEHLYELDSTTRHLVDYPTAEQITAANGGGWISGAKKNRMATIGVKMGTNDFRYPNSMCKGFSLKSDSGQLSELAIDFCSYDETRANYASGNWTVPTTSVANDNIVAHHQTLFQIGASESTLVNLGIIAFNAGFTIPLQVMQDTVSGTYIAEPHLEGKYGVTFGGTISRYSATTYQDYLDNWTSVVARWASRSGFYMQEMLIQEAKIKAAGPDESDVAQEAIELDVGVPTTNQWSSWLASNSLIQNGSMLMRVRSSLSANQMFAV